MSDNTEPKQRLLIVDDSKVIRVTARKILRDHFETIEAVDGENAWEVLNNEGPFSLVVSDLTMPNLDGFGLLERIRSSQHPDIHDIPVIIITGANDSETTKARASQAGATDFIGKPFDSVHLLARTQAHASAHAVTHALQQETFSLEEKVTTDPLSGLPNEIAFMERGYQQLSYAIRHKTALSLFLLEIDNYPELVRQHGKAVNEPIIRSVTATLHAEARQEDMVARTGTARFGLLLPGMNMAGIHHFSERLNRSISTSPLKQGEDRISLTISIGVSAPDIRRDTRLDDLLAEATRRLSIARSQGGNQTVFADATGDTIEVYAPDYADEPALSAEAAMELAAGARAKGPEAGIFMEPEPLAMPGDELQTIECREMPDSAPLPGRFAGPVPDSMGTAQAGMQVDNSVDGSNPHNGMTIQEPAILQGKAVFTIDDSDTGLEETIVITAPFDVHSPETRGNTSDADRKQRPGMADNAAPATTSSQPAVPGNTAAETKAREQAGADKSEDQAAATDTPPRKGFFRRLLAAIRSPFGRHKQA
jgi:two-component system cell cycle response regulator